MYSVTGKKLRISFVTFLFVTFTWSCIKNDIPYPTVYGNFTKFEVAGQLKEAEINTLSRTIMLSLADTTDISRVKILNWNITDKTRISPALNDYIDLTIPQTYTLSTYQDYKWTITGTQTITRIFRIEHQFESEQINTAQQTVIAYVPETVPLDSITITELKLGPTGSTITPDFKTVKDFTFPQKFQVSFRDKTEEWTIYIIPTKVLVTTKSADAWVTIAWLKGSGVIGMDNGFEIKKASENNWQKVDRSLITVNGAEFSARIPELTPQTEYVFRAYSGENIGSEISFTTESATPIPNGGFEQWHIASNDAQNPWEAGGNSFWDTGNGGAILIGKNVTTSTADKHSGQQAAQLQSQFVGALGIGQFAAGNIFTGSFVGRDGMDGILEFGRPYTSRPTGLKGFYKYIPKTIDYASATNPNLTYLKGKSDSCYIYIALCDWDKPLEIRTKASNRQLFNPKDPGVIAYAEFISGSITNTYQEFNLELKYNATDRKPKYVIIVASASKYGDYFTGGNGSILYLDDFELTFE